MMASLKVMASTSTKNTDLPRQSSSISSPISNIFSEPPRNIPSMNMDDLLKNLYSNAAGSNQQQHLDASHAFSLSREEVAGGKTVDEVWKELVAGSEQRRGEGGGEDAEEEMTLEDFLTKAGAVREEDVRVPVEYGVDATAMSGGEKYEGVDGAASVGFKNGIDRRVAATAPGARGKGKRRAVQEPLVDKATQQKQRRMIKNRESAARSRERKQAYTVELESLVTQLEEENARLLREEAEQSKERFKQLMENVIPVSEKRGRLHVLRRVNSMRW